MIFSSPHADVNIPNLSITDYVLQHAAGHGSKPALIPALPPALIDGPSGRTISYDELPMLIRRLAAGFASEGVGKRDVLAIYAPNLPECVLAFHAVASLGAMATMAPPLFTAQELTVQLNDSAARYLLTTAELLPRARAAAAAADIRKIFVIGESSNAISFARS
jgi:acyl-coenzyme A synthetase/AMP-(fatty) acid ligase